MYRPLRVRVAVCICQGDEILLVAHEKEGRRYWLLPGGGVEEGETLHSALRREVKEETNFDIAIGPLAIVCEAIGIDERHILNLVFAASVTGGSLAVGGDERLCDAAWHGREALSGLELYPAVPETIIECWDENFGGNTRFLGNVWRRAPPA